MIISLREVDVIGFLGLNKIMKPGEIDELLEGLNKEIWFRLFHQELPKILNQKEFNQLVKKHELASNLDSITAEIEQKWPHFNFRLIINKIATQVKKEFVLNYLTKLSQDYASNADLQKLITQIKTFFEKKELNQKKLDQFQQQLYRLVISAASD
ncbi:hypothetical protein A2313_00070 [Candidatus Roizmanbacteria bacterium RIFOXYB2_FULL_41_10]|uniref:Uncharacterized protein n=1 Tax=Candidatus Roizmanbacteria bacterium RIFOXYA1_FULL_41_12 TaxID=1802082 RepID=A0A1F7KAS4_9BACT|nr:MAG: hypothetical protein A2209_04650 [Candidatus Roizmanbacteria bacterium RIFOXYA1_FULL_41_12]OGK66786.1 MAG: hypothetical protein A2377_02675 [Candidatus Roizmanbacteria bacterium RIFOXYB1_FULL_41_27]OGK68035.1 MAG: hypothetical protein A2262_00230 [Candidatus Roizmanbacteria bacterium RIFOXYA2_FULL_41_8]OGK70839.1 MAG: hypothetical protein A2403_02030 [Candidatus Roizmanbacteria bacterium RIFOXYC1_FULL_41_16]OGK71369.1 MAG: hypothetical protein A2313_00070 [Candidatus Roizmanbacteria bac